MLRFSQVVIGEGGLPSCGTCAPHPESQCRPTDALVQEIRGVTAAHSSGPGPNISLVGTEAFLHPQLPALIAAAVDAGAERVGFMTGGQALSQGGNAAGIIHAGVRHVDVVLLGDEATHDQLSGSPGAYAAAREGVAALHTAAERAGVPLAVMGHVPVCRHNVHSIPGAVADLVAMGVIAVHLQPDEKLDVARNIEWFGAAFQTGIMHGTWVCVEPADVQLFGRWALHVGVPCHVGGGAQ